MKTRLVIGFAAGLLGVLSRTAQTWITPSEWQRRQYRTVEMTGEFVSDCGEWAGGPES